METVPFQYMFCISFVITCISNGCLVLVCWVFFFPRKIILCFQTIFQAYTWKRQDIHIFWTKEIFWKVCKQGVIILIYSFLESFPITKLYPVILQSLIILQKNTSFIKCLYFQKHTEICKQSIFKYAFAINTRLLLLQFITCNRKPYCLPSGSVCTN